MFACGIQVRCRSRQSVIQLCSQALGRYAGQRFQPLIAGAWSGPPPGVQRRFYGELLPPLAMVPATGTHAQPVPIGLALEQARAHWPGPQAAVVDIQHPGDAQARIST